jgi:hypothetical protein
MLNSVSCLPKLLTYLDERKQHGKRWVESMISTAVPLYQKFLGEVTVIT